MRKLALKLVVFQLIFGFSSEVKSQWTLSLEYDGATCLTSLCSNLFAGNGSGIFRSTNDGTDWTRVDSGLTNLNVPTLATDGNNLFAGTGGGGIFRSSNMGETWEPINSGLTNLIIETDNFFRESLS